jgi:fatty-acyl-CoA synthase
MSVAEIIRLHGRHRPASEAFLIGEEVITYGQLDADVDRVAQALTAAGIAKGDRVAALGKNSYEYVQLYFALARIGALLVPLSFWHRRRELAHALSDSEPRMLFVEPELMEPVGPALAELGFPLEVVRLVGQDGSDEEWRAFVAGGEGTELAAVEIEPEDPHMILYTSGTTGRPKGALLSHGRTVQDAHSMAIHFRLRPGDTYMEYFPSFHVGNWDHLKLFLLVGARTVLLREFDPDAVIDAIERHRPTVMLGVPTMFHALLDNPRWAETDLSCFRLVYYGGYDPSALMERVAESFGARQGGAEIAHTYGLTEGGSFVSICQGEELFEHWGSIGRPLIGVEVALLDDEMNEVEIGEPGEICVRGPRMSGYWRNPEETAKALAGDWLHTGDMAVSDAEGYMTIVDRKKDMIRTGGQNVYSKEVEDLLSQHEKVDEVAVIGLPDPVYEELVCAVIVPQAPHQPGEQLAEELTAHVREQLAGYNTPKRIEFVAELPKNAVGKTEKHRLREQLGSMFDVDRAASSAGS